MTFPWEGRGPTVTKQFKFDNIAFTVKPLEETGRFGSRKYFVRCDSCDRTVHVGCVDASAWCRGHANWHFEEK